MAWASSRLKQQRIGGLSAEPTESGSRDLARFGILMADEGRWKGRRVRAITRPRSDAVRPDGGAMPGVGYGLMWWTRDETATREIYGAVGENVFVASGTGQQILLVAPTEISSSFTGQTLTCRTRVP